MFGGSLAPTLTRLDHAGSVPAAILAGGRARRMAAPTRPPARRRARIIDRQLAALAAVADDIRSSRTTRPLAGLGVPAVSRCDRRCRARSAASTRRLLRRAARRSSSRVRPAVRDGGPARAPRRRGGRPASVDAVMPRTARGSSRCARLSTRVRAATGAPRIARALKPPSGCSRTARRERPEECWRPTIDGRCSRTSTRRMITSAPGAGLNRPNEKPSEDRITE